MCVCLFVCLFVVVVCWWQCVDGWMFYVFVCECARVFMCVCVCVCVGVQILKKMHFAETLLQPK